MPAVLCVVGLGLTGCTGEPEPSTTTTTTTSATPSPTPSPTPAVATAPERPAAMATASADGAAAAASYFISLYPYVYATGDLAEWDALADPSCEFCTMVSDEVEDLHSRGHSVVSPLVVVSSSGIELEAQRWYSAEVVVEIAESSEFDRQGQIVKTDGAGAYRTTYSLTWAGGWRVDAVGLEPEAAGS